MSIYTFGIISFFLDFFIFFQTKILQSPLNKHEGSTSTTITFSYDTPEELDFNGNSTQICFSMPSKRKGRKASSCDGE